MGLKWVEKRVAVELIMVFDANLHNTVSFCSRYTQHNITILNLPVVESDLRPLIHLTLDEFCGAISQALSLW